MAAPKPRSSSPLRLRLALRNGRAFGPGKADLLEAIATLGSIAAAGRALSMSYKRAWQLVEDLNASFELALVTASKGGGKGGGAVLTPTGRRVLTLYRHIEAKSREAAATELAALQRLASSIPNT